ncbi:MAG: DUF1080 domain-containing protein [Thermoguttaceae bacterium]|nr:DUF1080 domain-containing protein [Thermoguttaceae bacterium]
MNYKKLSVALFPLFLFFGALVGAEDALPLLSQEELSAEAREEFEALKAGDVSKLPALEKALFDARLSARARSVLEALPEKAGLPALRKGLDSPTPSVVAECLASLGYLNDVDSIDRVAALTDESRELIVRVAALRTLGRLASKSEAEVLQNALADASSNIREAAADGLFSLGARFADPEMFRQVRDANVSESSRKIAVQNEILLTSDVELFRNLLKSGNPSDFKAACFALSQTDSRSIIEATISLLRDLPLSSRERLIGALGARRNDLVVNGLVSLLRDDQTEDSTKLALIKTLGDVGASNSFDALFSFLSSQDSALREAAIDAICRLESLPDANVAKIASSMKSDDIVLAQSCIAVVAQKSWSSTIKETESLALNSPCPEIANPALEAFVNSTPPAPRLIETFFERYGNNKSVSRERLEDCLETLCRRSAEKESTITALEKTFRDKPVLLARYVGALGGKQAADYIGKLALEACSQPSEDSIEVVDEVTKALGRWDAPDADESLARLAILLPGERFGKFKTRAIRGYLRIVRQMGEFPLEKMRKVYLAKQLTENRPQERELLSDIDSRFSQKFKERSLFNGENLDGWEEYEPGVFKVEDGAIVGGNFNGGVDRNQFLTSIETFSDFYLRLECKIVVGGDNPNNDGNAGIQFRSSRVPNNWEMIGYQADMSSDGAYWGCLYDESRRNRMLQTSDSALREAVLRPDNWNVYEVLARGNNVKIFLNGVKTVDYEETDENVPLTGKIGLQIHAGGSAKAYYRNIFICDTATDDSN